MLLGVKMEMARGGSVMVNLGDQPDWVCNQLNDMAPDIPVKALFVGWFEAESLCVVLTILELPMKARLVSQRSSCLCLPISGISVFHHAQLRAHSS